MLPSQSQCTHLRSSAACCSAWLAAACRALSADAARASAASSFCVVRLCKSARSTPGVPGGHVGIMCMLQVHYECARVPPS